jgi:two-component system NtrC family response regulator
MPLIERSVKHFAALMGKEVVTIDPVAQDMLLTYAWPGNVRELQNRVRRAIIMCSGKRLGPQDLELASAGGVQPGASLKDAREAVEREMVLQALRKHDGKISAAAAELEISRPTFYELMDKLGVKRSE